MTTPDDSLSSPTPMTGGPSLSGRSGSSPVSDPRHLSGGPVEAVPGAAGMPPANAFVANDPATAGPVAGGLPIDNGSITVSATVVAKIAALAAQEVAGIHALGVGTARSVPSVRERIPGAAPSPTAGVSVEVGRTQAAVDLDVVVEYGIPIIDIARNVRRQVISAVEQLTGLQVIEVNITVDDVNLPAMAAPRDKRLQ